MKKKKLLIPVLILFAFINVINAQDFKFYEITKTFFKTDKSYDIAAYMMVFRPDDMTFCKKGDAKVTVKGSTVTIKYKDGSGSPREIEGDIKDCIVYTGTGDVKIPMYILDDGTAIRAIRYEYGGICLHSYFYNYNMKKYIHAYVYNLY